MCAARNVNKLQAAAPAEPKVGRAPEQPAHAEGGRHRAAKRSRALVRDIVRDRRAHARLPLGLAVRLTRVNGHAPVAHPEMVTKDISSSGAFVVAPVQAEAGTQIELQIGLTDRALGRKGGWMCASAQVVRVVPGPRPGWHGLGIKFDTLSFDWERRSSPRAVN